jgi:hypothetical protein
MGEWTLPADAASRYAELVEAQKSSGRYDATKGFIRGGIWRNFLSRYPESNWMHKRMLALSARVAALPEGPDKQAATGLLHLGQANDAYWHGLFGGLYLPHLRRAVWGHLIELERTLDRLAPRPSIERSDVDHDGHDELFLHNDAVQAVVRGDGTGAIRELDGYALAQNFGDTLRRHLEHYHRKVLAGAQSAHAGDGIASAHDRVTFKHEISPELLAPDNGPRDLFRDTWIGEDGAATPIAGYAAADDGGEHAGGGPRVALRAEARDGAIAKSIALADATVSVTYDVQAQRPGRLRVELDVAMPSCDGFSGRYLVGEHVPGGFGSPLVLDAAEALTLDDRYLCGSLALRVSPPARIAAAPYHTVSQSEEGFERVMQSVVIGIEWPVAAAGETVRLEAQLAVRDDGKR